MNGGKSILMAPWGDPRGWILTCYKRPRKVSRGGEECYSSFTSLKPLIAYINPGETIVLAADTLAGLVEAPLSGYSDVLKTVEDYVGNFLCGIKARIEVLPGVINSPSTRVTGDPRDYYFMVLYHASRRILEGKVSEIALDLTHGINYMPAMAYRALREAAALAGLMSSGEASLQVYNSDPIVPGELGRVCGRNLAGGEPCRPRHPEECGRRIREASLNLMLKERLGTLNVIAELSGLLAKPKAEVKPLTSRRRLGGDKKKVLRDANGSVEELVEEALMLLRLARYGLAPELAAYLESRPRIVHRLEEAFSKLYGAWRETIEVKAEGGRILITRPLRFSAGFRVLIYAWIIAAAVTSILGGNGATLEAVWSLGERLYRGSKMLHVIQVREKEKLDKKLREKAVETCSSAGKPMMLGEIYGHGYEDKTGCEVFKRDLLSHGGWHTDVVELHARCIDGRVDKRETRLGIAENTVCRENRGKELDVWRVLQRL